jgi:multiple sugar transport system ATP-binding protein
MPEIELRNVCKRWKDFYATDHMNLFIPDKSFVTLLGPSGCGKTTVLRMIAGLETPTSGQILIDHKPVFDSDAGINIPANKRKVGFLFQNYALWPNMTVYQNIAFGLKNVKDDLPLIDFRHRTRKDVIRVLADPAHVGAIVNDCRDKKGKINDDRALIHLIDEYLISMQTAKEIYKLHLEENGGAERAKKAIADAQAEMKQIEEKHHQKGEALSDKSEILVKGQPVIRERKLEDEEIDLAVRHVSRVVKVGEFMARYPNELSGGQQQRVAIARTLAPGPKVLFMDEPLSNLDAKLRLEMRSELKRLHVDTGATFVYVTHDQLEAMTLATQICLINNGVLQQYDPPLTVYNKPKNLFVADFVGNPAMTLIEAKTSQNPDGSIDLGFFDDRKATFIPNEPINLEKERADRDTAMSAEKARLEAEKKERGFVEKGNKDLAFNYHVFKTDGTHDRKDEKAPEPNDYVIGIRPEYISIAESGAGLKGTVYSAMPSGMETTIKVAVNGYILTSVIFGAMDFKIDEDIEINFKGDNILLFDKVSGNLISSGKIVLK